jgi:hypothetical protein
MNSKVSLKLVEGLARRNGAKGGELGERGLIEEGMGLAKARKLARLLEKHKLYVFCADVLERHGLYGELGELAKRVWKMRGAAKHYVRIKAWMAEGDEDGMLEEGKGLTGHGVRGAYLLGKALVGHDRELAKKMADGLAAEGREKRKPDCAASSGSKEEDADAILTKKDIDAILARANSNSFEETLYAMKIYLQLGMDGEAGECFGGLCGLGGAGEVYARAIMEQGEGAAPMPVGIEGARGASLTVNISKYTASMVQKLGARRAEYRHDTFAGVMPQVEKYLEELMGEESLGIAIGEIERSARAMEGRDAGRAVEAQGIRGKNGVPALCLLKD